MVIMKVNTSTKVCFLVDFSWLFHAIDKAWRANAIGSCFMSTKIYMAFRKTLKEARDESLSLKPKTPKPVDHDQTGPDQNHVETSQKNHPKRRRERRRYQFAPTWCRGQASNQPNGSTAQINADYGQRWSIVGSAFSSRQRDPRHCWAAILGQNRD